MTEDDGTEGQVGHHDDATQRSHRGCHGRRRRGERTRGRPRRLRQRIFTASQAGDLKKVRNLQKLMLRSRANTLLSVRRVTEVNAGRKTAGDRRTDGAAAPVQGRVGRLGAVPLPAVDSQARQTRVHPQGQGQAPSRDSCDR
ncbi:reverse transcriptase N-terminal domain-containing protein [Streptomyces sp. NPDC059909]|uniref:reverse transcriptase N-terminal domain-containing protein n=1 Tax=Streptomyces sp. NPDC059909 TaxID=3346998 RepID=UPI003647A30D